MQCMRGLCVWLGTITRDFFEFDLVSLLALEDALLGSALRNDAVAPNLVMKVSR